VGDEVGDGEGGEVLPEAVSGFAEQELLIEVGQQRPVDGEPP